MDRICRADRGFDTIGPRTGLFLGVAQALALQPGVSRSGVTLTAARLIGLDRESAARFSFLLACRSSPEPASRRRSTLPTPACTATARSSSGASSASAVSGFAVIWFLLRYLRRHDFLVFMIYRLAVAALVLALIATGVRSATI